ncbi:tetratricopeptide repeat protein [Crocosphaera sp. XPORK-15E]|uniref:tetratricopeptide repeat protein n=1 Tax=Crocosphaera sp. XPORK-15E TaxID=3110247 RepID=UPI002B1F2817|nr:tetratricopeptide repeat protein [Crocosphaera sp. XPORK-15E]MEA5532468.1 tetratricopeptide repeat protein [Crocosphaera sp. XPORK-15E]
MMKNYSNDFLKFIILLVTVLFCVGFSSQANSDLSQTSQSSQLFYQGVIHLNQENYQQAILNFTKVIDEDNPLIAAAYTNRCLAHLQLNNNQSAKQDCTEALSLNSENIEAYLNQGMANYRLGNFSDSLAAYKEVIKRDQNDYRAYYNQALVYFQLKDYERALEGYEKALQSHQLKEASPKAMIYYDRGLVHLQLGDFSLAIADLTHAIILDKYNDRAYYNRAYAYQKSGNYRLAFQDFNEVIKLNPQSTSAYVNRGIVEQNLGFKKAAFHDFKIALEQYKQQEKMMAYEQALNLIQQLKRIIAQSHETLIS